MAFHKELHASCPLPDGDEPAKGSCKPSQPVAEGHPSGAVPASLDPGEGQPNPKRRRVEEGSFCESPSGQEAIECHETAQWQSGKGPSKVEQSEAEVKQRGEVASYTRPGLTIQTTEEEGGSGVHRQRVEEGGLAGPNPGARGFFEEQWAAKGGDEHMMHVLAVDDSPVDRKLVERLLKDVPYKVTTAESGVHALGVLGLDQAKAKDPEGDGALQKAAPNFDLIMTDYSMPGITGYQLLQRLKKEETGLERVPVVIMSSDNYPKRVAKCIEGGAEEYLQKPVQASDISRINAQILKRKESGDARSPSPGPSSDPVASPGRLPREPSPVASPGRLPRAPSPVAFPEESAGARSPTGRLH